MATRATVKLWIRNFLGTEIDDPLYGDTSATSGISTLLDPIVQQCVDGLIHEIQLINRGYLAKTATLLADGGTGRVYSLASQSTPIVDFAHWLEVRHTDRTGVLLDEVRLDELSDGWADSFAVRGPDAAFVIETSPATTEALPLWFQYGYWPAALANDNTAIPAIPAQFHDVVALEALFVFAIGGDSVRPPELRERWLNRRALLFQHLSQRGVQPARTRLA
jgi:hypothetical protein